VVDTSEGVAILPIIDVLLLDKNITENNAFEHLYSLPKHQRCTTHTHTQLSNDKSKFEYIK
jgi:hypothetical protein